MALSLSTESFNNNTVLIYPNPVATQLTIQLNDNETGTIIIHNQLGQKVLTKNVSNQQNTINVTSLASGIYFYDFSSNNSKLQGKLIKK